MKHSPRQSSRRTRGLPSRAAAALVAAFVLLGPLTAACADGSGANDSQESGALRVSARKEKGLLGSPLPAGAILIERVAGDPTNGVDPRERYEIRATSQQIMAFYDVQMRKAGWQMDQPVRPTARFYKKGNLLLGVMTNNDGGTFTLMGS